MKKLVSALTAFAMLCALIPSFVSAKTFTDTQGHWAQSYISELSDLGIINGYPEGYFSPDANITRAEYVTMCNNAFPKAIDMTGFTLATEVWFNDAQGDTWFGDAIMRAASNGLVNGRGNGIFDPNAPITRQEAAVITYNYLNKIGFDFTYDNGEGSDYPFRDTNAEWANNAIVDLNAFGIINGYEDNTFRALNTITRAETAAIIDRAYNMANASTTTPTPTSQSSISPTPLITLSPTPSTSTTPSTSPTPSQNTTPTINSQTVNDKVVRAGASSFDTDNFLEKFGLNLTAILNQNYYYFGGLTNAAPLPGGPIPYGTPADELNTPLSLVSNNSKEACIFYGVTYDPVQDGGGSFSLATLQNKYPNLNFREFYETVSTTNTLTKYTVYYIATRNSDLSNSFGNQLYNYLYIAPMPVAKPVIYLYPTTPTNVTVTLGYPDQLSATYPKYNNGWNVLAQPNGDLTDLTTGRSLYGLYWEGGIARPTIDEGFCVPSGDVIPFLEEKLAILGLNEREADEFIIYWLPIMQQNPYNYVKFLSQDEINKIMPLTVTPTPDSIIRVLMVVQGGNQPINLPEQQLTPVTRSGFSVVEWGGTILKGTIK